MAYKKYELRFWIFDFEEQAATFCKNWNKKQTYHIRRKYPANYSAWVDPSTRRTRYIAWFKIAR